ncbi:glycosyl transferase family 2 [Actinomycetes bacterium]|nr:glycosyl transferase family 2 [Actinomycetes bacterium]
MTRVVAVVQARMGSQRFPGKMLAKLGNQTLLAWVLTRVMSANLIDETILATSSSAQDDDLVADAEKFGVRIVRGSESDVLSRFNLALEKTNADQVVRVCADNPFVAGEEIDRLVHEFQSGDFDYACNHQQRLSNNYADGFGAEILSVKLLKELSAIATEPSHREHVTSYIWDNQSKFRVRAVDAPAELAFPDIRLDIDTPEDLFRLDAFVKKFAISTDTSATQIIESFRKYMG